MANTFKFGNGNWAVKDGYALAYNDENNNFKPLPFDFTRASSATTLNRQGLIETVPSGKPRIDFLNNTSGHLLLEPSRTNYSIYSQDTSTWTYTEFGGGSAGTITTGKTDMFGGTNAVQVDFPSNAENVSVRFGHTSSSISSGSAQTSLYIKLVGSTTPDKILRFRTGGDVEDFTVSGDSFVRYTKTHTKGINEAFNLKIRPSDGTSSGGFSIIICHPQEEAGSYATSYIPTEGSSVTRVAEAANDAGNSTVFNNSEGVFYAEISALADDLTFRRLTISNNSYSNTIDILITNITNQIRVLIRDNNVTTSQMSHTVSNIVEFNKVAIKYKSGDSSLWINGSNVGNISDTFTLPTLTDLSFDRGDGTSNFYGKVKDLKVYNTALTDTELQNLTS